MAEQGFLCRWTNSLATAHSKMGGPTFVNEKGDHILEKN